MDTAIIFFEKIINVRSVDQMRKRYNFKIKGVKVFAACNEITRLPKALQSRFRRLAVLKSNVIIEEMCAYISIASLWIVKSRICQITAMPNTIPYRNRYTIGQFTIMPTVPNGLPPNPVNHPFSTNPKIVNSSSILDRYPLSIAFWVH